MTTKTIQCKRYSDKEHKIQCANIARHNILLGEDCFDFNLYVCDNCLEQIKQLKSTLIQPYTVVKLA